MTTKANVRATFTTYALVRERVIPTPAGQKLVLQEGSAVDGITWAVAYRDYRTGEQDVLLRLSTDTRIANERLSAALATLMELRSRKVNAR